MELFNALGVEATAPSANEPELSMFVSKVKYCERKFDVHDCMQLA